MNKAYPKLTRKDLKISLQKWEWRYKSGCKFDNYFLHMDDQDKCSFCKKYLCSKCPLYIPYCTENGEKTPNVYYWYWRNAINHKKRQEWAYEIYKRLIRMWNKRYPKEKIIL